jgi:hypothetical protein
MKPIIKDRMLQIDLEELIDGLDDKGRQLLARYSVFEEALLSAIVDTVVTGSAFEEGWYIGEMDQRLRLKLLPLLPDAYQELVRKLLQQRDSAKAERQKALDQLERAARHWPREVQPNQCTSTRPEYCYCPWTSAQLEKELAATLGENWKANCTPAQETVT